MSVEPPSGSGPPTGGGGPPANGGSPWYTQPLFVVGGIAAVIIAIIIIVVVALAGGNGDDGEEETGQASPSPAMEETATPAAEETPAGAVTPAPPTPTPTPEPTPTPAGATTVGVGLVEFAVNPAQDTVDAGALTFNVSNDGTTDHTFRVIKTDLAPDALPTAASQVDEAQVDVVASTPDFAAGETQEVSVDLEAGSYVLICNLPGHYDLGMRAAFTVE